MKKVLSLIMTAFMLFSLIPAAVMAEETATESEYIRYMFDFDTDEGTPAIANQPSQVSIAGDNGSKALKVEGDWNPGSFSIELPEAVKTKYALVKIKTTRIVGDGESYYHFDTAPAYKDSNGNESMRLRYAYGKNVCSGDGVQEIGVPQNGVTEEFEAVIDFTAQTVTYGENTKRLAETANDIKSIYFMYDWTIGSSIYYFDDIEVIGFNDYSAIKPSAAVPANGAKDIDGFEKEIIIEYPIAVTEGFLASQNITVTKNGEELKENTDYRVAASGKKVLITLSEEFGFGAEVAVSVNGAEVTSFKSAGKDYLVSYKYDFDSEETTPVISNQPSQVTVEEYNGSKALKVAPNGGMSSFSIELPEAVKTKYVLVKIKGTPETNDSIIYQASPAYRDSDGNEAMRFRYWYDKQIFYGSDASFTGSYSTTILSPYPKAGEPGEFEALMDLSSSTVSFGNDTGYFLNKVKDIKSLVFEFDGNSNATVYFDDIEVIGFNDYSAIKPSAAIPANGAKDIDIFEKEISLEYPIAVTEGFLAMQNITVSKNGKELTKDTDYTVAASGKKVLITLSEEFGFGAEVAVSVNGEEVTRFKSAGKDYTVSYKYDFDTAEGTPVIANQPSQVSIEEYNGSKALKVAGNGSDGYFSIELPKAVKTKYALVKVKTTSLRNDERVDFVNAPAFKDSNGRKSMYIRYGYDKYVYSGDGAQNMGVPANGVTEEFEAVIDFTEQTVTYGENTKPLCETATDIKSIYFEFGSCNDIFYFDDIEIIGFNDYSVIKPSEAVPANGAKDIDIFEKEIIIEYPIAVTESFLAMQNITVSKNGKELTKDTDYTVAASGKKVLITLSEEFGFGAEVAVSVNGEEVTRFKSAGKDYTVSYKYDFDTAEGTPVIANQPSQVSIEEYNGSKALKVAGNGSDGYFSIELPKAVKTKYALVKVKTTSLRNDERVDFVNAPAFKDSNGRKSMYIRYGYDKYVYSGDGAQNMGVPANGVTEEFEAVIDFTEQTVTYGENTKPLCETATDIKSIYFEFGSCNDIFYFDDIEIIGFNDYSVITEPSYKVISLTADGEEVASLADAKGKTLEIAVEKTGDFEVIGAIYDGNKLIGLSAVENGKISLAVPSDADTKTYTVNIYAWESLQTLSPIFEANPIF